MPIHAKTCSFFVITCSLPIRIIESIPFWIYNLKGSYWIQICFLKSIAPYENPLHCIEMKLKWTKFEITNKFYLVNFHPKSTINHTVFTLTVFLLFCFCKTFCRSIFADRVSSPRLFNCCFNSLRTISSSSLLKLAMSWHFSGMEWISTVVGFTKTIIRVDRIQPRRSG